MGADTVDHEPMFAALRDACADKRVLSVGDNMGDTVVQLAHVARVLWQVPFCAPLGEERRTLRLRRHMAQISHLVDTGRLVQIDATPRYVLSNLHESAFDLVFLHGYTTGADMADYLETCQHLTKAIVVHAPGNQPAHDAIRDFAEGNGAGIKVVGLLTQLWPDPHALYPHWGW